MGLFSYNFYGSGHDAPPKTGPARLWALFTGNIGGLLGGGAFAALSSAVYAVGMMVGIDSHGLIIALIAGPLGGVLALPQLCGLTDTVLRALRNESGSWWQTYRRAWRQNVKGCLFPGALGGLLFSFQLFIFAHFERLELDLFLLIAMVLGVMASTAIATWFLPQLALVDLPLGRAILNAMLLCVRYPLRTLGVTLLQLIYWAFIVVGFPHTLVLFFLLNFWLPALLVTMVLYDPLDEIFHIEDEIEARRAQANHNGTEPS